MLPDLATSLSTALATASLLFFLAVYTVVVVQVVRGRREDLDAHARMALDPPPPEAPEGGLVNDGAREHTAHQGVR